MHQPKQKTQLWPACPPRFLNDLKITSLVACERNISMTGVLPIRAATLVPRGLEPRTSVQSTKMSHQFRAKYPLLSHRNFLTIFGRSLKGPPTPQVPKLLLGSPREKKEEWVSRHFYTADA